MHSASPLGNVRGWRGGATFRPLGDEAVRIAALFCGLIAGLFVLLAPSALGVDLMSTFLAFWTDSSNERLLGTVGWYALAGAAMFGGLLATVTPGFAALLLLGAAVGWLGIGVSVPQLFTYQLLGPAAAATVGALFAFLAGELQVRRRRMARRSRKLAAEFPTNEVGEIEREAALRMDPLLMPRQDAPPAPKRAIPLTLDDVTVTSRPASDPPRWQELDSPQPPRRRDPGTWAEARREAVPLVAEAPVASDEPETRPEPKPEVRRRDPEQLRPEPQRRRAATRAERGRGWIAALAAVLAVFGLGIIAAGGYKLTRDGTLQALLGGPPSNPVVITAGDAPATGVAATPPAAPVKIELPAPPTKSEAAAAPIASPAAHAPAAPAAEVAAPETAAPLRVSGAAAPESYDDPFSYCRAVGTIDYIDHRYTGPAVTEAMTRVLLIPASSRARPGTLALCRRRGAGLHLLYRADLRHCADGARDARVLRAEPQCRSIAGAERPLVVRRRPAATAAERQLAGRRPRLPAPGLDHGARCRGGTSGLARRCTRTGGPGHDARVVEHQSVDAALNQ